MLTLQALKATSQEKSDFLRRERDTWVAWQDERAAREAADGELTKECEVFANLRRRCSGFEIEARDARDARAKVAPLEKRVSDLVQESLERNTATERYKGEVIRVETLLAQKVPALNQAQRSLPRLGARFLYGRAGERKQEARAR